MHFGVECSVTIMYKFLPSSLLNKLLVTNVGCLLKLKIASDGMPNHSKA